MSVALLWFGARSEACIRSHGGNLIVFICLLSLRSFGAEPHQLRSHYFLTNCCVDTGFWIPLAVLCRLLSPVLHPHVGCASPSQVQTSTPATFSLLSWTSQHPRLSRFCWALWVDLIPGSGYSQSGPFPHSLASWPHTKT